MNWDIDTYMREAFTGHPIQEATFTGHPIQKAI